VTILTNGHKVDHSLNVTDKELRHLGWVHLPGVMLIWYESFVGGQARHYMHYGTVLSAPTVRGYVFIGDVSYWVRKLGEMKLYEGISKSFRTVSVNKRQ
jgi:hypothetical protein